MSLPKYLQITPPGRLALERVEQEIRRLGRS